ncbi:FAD:protein FMN transferase [Marinobacterium arenosum]|uniref:FAD:protein FMN transferase n=1 Tax=Marinobacterium arenosum TaxID=2862496 RepID=UPI002104407F|nr:FAD:protein FMN transferase [Marinobacterium arenosum]
MSVNGLTMGTGYTVKWVGQDPQAVTELHGRIDQQLQAINDSMSTYIDSSELSRLNRTPQGEWFALSAELFEVLLLARQISEQSAGQFDPTVGPLVNLWGFGPDGRVERAPSDAEIEARRGRIGYQFLELDTAKRRVRKQRDLYVDLSAIAKGYGVDIIARLLEENGIDRYLVEIGGELRVKGSKPDGSSWRLAIESPDSAGRSVHNVIELGQGGIATSGDYRNYFEQDGVRFSHTIDPHTGRPVVHKLASVTVIADNCAAADAYATTLLVMGEERGYAFALEQGLDAYFIVKAADGFETRYTPGFNNYLKH